MDFDAPIVVRTRLGSVRGACRNLSEGGLFFTGPLLPVGERVFLSVALSPQQTLQIEGQVTYQHAYPDGSGMGVRFTMISTEDRSTIARVVERLHGAAGRRAAV